MTQTLAKSAAKQHRQPPKIEAPFAVADAGYGKTYAETAIKSWQSERAEIEQLANTLRGLTGWLSVASGMPAGAVWDQLTGDA